MQVVPCRLASTVGILAAQKNDQNWNHYVNFILRPFDGEHADVAGAVAQCNLDGRLNYITCLICYTTEVHSPAHDGPHTYAPGAVTQPNSMD